MEQRDNQRSDQMMREKLLAHEAGFVESDWVAMQQLLDQDHIIPVPPLGSSDALQSTIEKSINVVPLKKFIVMTSIILSTLLLVFTPSLHEAPSGVVKNQPEITPFINEIVVEEARTGANPKAGISSLSQKEIVLTEAKDPAEVSVETPEISGENDNDAELTPQPITPMGEDSMPKPNKVVKTVTRKYWVDDRYEYISKKPSRDIEQFWWSIHYTQFSHLNQSVYESMGLRTHTHGFSTEFMSGNLLKGEDLAIYGGLDFGMQFQGRSEESKVILNSVNEDAGLTSLRSSNMDFMARAHLEYARFPLIPYVTLTGGPRIFMTGQYVESLVTSTEYESSNSHNVHASASMMGGIGAGFRLKLSPRVSLDTRYTYFTGDAVSMVDLKNSLFKGAEYTLSKNTVATGGHQFRFGLAFDLSSEDPEKVLVEPGHYEEREEMISVDPQDSTKVFIPCPCIPCEKKEVIIRQDSSYPGTYNSGPGNWRTPSSGSGGTKSSFPGIKTPPPARH